MDTKISHLIYVSRAVKLMQSADLIEILNTARNVNKTLDVTGLLLYKDQSFLQVLEGMAESIENLFNKISADDRHYQVRQLIFEKKGQRDFSQWTMGFQNLDELTAEHLPGYSKFMNADYDISGFINQPEISYQLLLHFRNAS